MAIRYYNPIWEIDPEYVKNLPAMDFWRDIHGNIIDFEAEKAKGNTGFLYEIDRPNTQLYDGSKQIDNDVGRYCGTGACCIVYDKRYGTNGIKRTVLEFHSGTRDELFEAEERLLKELGVVEDDQYLNMTDETMLNGINNANILPSFGEIIAIGLDGTHYRFENELHAAHGLSEALIRKITPRAIKGYIKGTNLTYKKFLLDIKLADMSAVEELLLEQTREETKEKNIITSKKLSKSAKECQNRPEVKKKKSKSIKAAQTPELQKRKSKKQKETNKKPEVKARRKKAMKEVANRPDVKKKKIEKQKETNKTPESFARRSKANKEAQSRPEVREKQKKSAKITNQKPEVKARRSKAMKEAQNRPEVVAKKSESAKKAHQRPETKAKRKKGYEARKKEGILIFQDENKPDLKFKGKEDGAKKAGVEKSTFHGWIYGGSKTFKKFGIKKIIWGKKVIE